MNRVERIEGLMRFKMLLIEGKVEAFKNTVQLLGTEDESIDTFVVYEAAQKRFDIMLSTVNKELDRLFEEERA